MQRSNRRWQPTGNSERYHRPGFFFGTEPNAFLVSNRHLLRPGQTVLALADGEGRNGVWLAAQGLDVLSVDFSAPALVKAQELAALRGVVMRTEQVDLATWEMPAAAFDVVCAIFIQFAGSPLRDRLFTQMRRALKSGGFLLLQGYRPEQLAYKTGGPPTAANMYTRELLQASFAGMSELAIAEHDSIIHEGSGHDGMSALIDLVARK